MKNALFLRPRVVIPCNTYYLIGNKSKMNNILEDKIQFTGNSKRKEATKPKLY